MNLTAHFHRVRTRARVRAAGLRKMHGGSQPPFDAETIAERVGLDVVHAHHDGVTFPSQVCAFLDPVNDRIVRLKGSDPAASNRAIAHLLGRRLLEGRPPTRGAAVTSPPTSVPDTREHELIDIADAFALELIAPSRLIRHYLAVGSREKIAHVFMIPAEDVDAIAIATTR